MPASTNSAAYMNLSRKRFSTGHSSITLKPPLVSMSYCSGSMINSPRGRYTPSLEDQRKCGMQIQPNAWSDYTGYMSPFRGQYEPVKNRVLWSPPSPVPQFYITNDTTGNSLMNISIPPSTPYSPRTKHHVFTKCAQYLLIARKQQCYCKKLYKEFCIWHQSWQDNVQGA